MHCQECQQLLDDYLDGQLPPSREQTVRDHLAECGDCRDELEQTRELVRLLADAPLPPMRGEFPALALRRARQGQPHYRHHAVAAALLVGVLVALFALPLQHAPSVDAVRIALHQQQNVTLAFNSPEAMEQVTLALELPAGIQLAGFPGQRQLSWQTSLKSGPNLLTLPLIADGREGGRLVARLLHQGQEKQFDLELVVSPDGMTHLTPRLHYS